MATPTWKGPTDQLVEANNSPQYKNTKNGSDKIQVFHGLFTYCESIQADFAAGTFGTGAETGYTSAGVSLDKVRGGIGQLTINWEASGAGSGAILPQDEISVTPDNQSPRLERHPLFLPLENLTAGSDDEEEFVLEIVENQARASTPQQRRKAEQKIASSGLSSGNKALYNTLLKKIRRGFESYYLTAVRYSWVTHSWTVPFETSNGGYAENPGGPLGDYFVSGISWLREADDLQFSNGVWRLTRNWLGGPDGYWDPEIYGAP